LEVCQASAETACGIVGGKEHSDAGDVVRLPDATKRLLRHIKEILGVTGNPRTNAEWRTALRHWL
jgi:hypothetical protein